MKHSLSACECVVHRITFNFQGCLKNEGRRTFCTPDKIINLRGLWTTRAPLDSTSNSFLLKEFIQNFWDTSWEIVCPNTYCTAKVLKIHLNSPLLVAVVGINKRKNVCCCSCKISSFITSFSFSLSLSLFDKIQSLSSSLFCSLRSPHWHRWSAPQLTPSPPGPIARASSHEPLCYHSEQDGKKLQFKTWSLLFRCCSLPSGCPALRGITIMCADVQEICLPPSPIAKFIGMADWQMLMVRMYARTEHCDTPAFPVVYFSSCEELSQQCDVCVCVGAMIYWWGAVCCCWICNRATVAATKLAKNVLFC